MSAEPALPPPALNGLIADTDAELTKSKKVFVADMASGLADEMANKKTNETVYESMIVEDIAATKA